MPASTAIKTSKSPTATQVAAEILARQGGPMRVAELTRAVVKSGRVTRLKGKTPQATVAADIYVAAKAGRIFKRVDRGVVDLLDRV